MQFGMEVHGVKNFDHILGQRPMVSIFSLPLIVGNY